MRYALAAGAAIAAFAASAAAQPPSQNIDWSKPVTGVDAPVAAPEITEQTVPLTVEPPKSSKLALKEIEEFFDTLAEKTCAPANKGCGVTKQAKPRARPAAPASPG